MHDEFKHSQEKIGTSTSTLNNAKRVQRSVECAKQLFPKERWISIYSGAIKVKCKKLFPSLLTLQTSADAIVRFTDIKKDGTSWNGSWQMLQGICPLTKGWNSIMPEVSH